MTTSACPSSSDITPVSRSIRSFCSGVLITSSRLAPPDDGVLGALERLDDPAEPLVEQARGLHGLGELADLGEQVVAHPGHRGELHPVGLLVQAHPQPEVGGVGLELALDVDDVGRDEQEAAGRVVERVELAEDLAAEEAEQPAHLGAGDLGADRRRRSRWAASCRCSLSTTGPSRVANASALACTHPARSTTSTGAVRSAAARPVNSRTSAVDRSAPARSSATVAAASSRLTVGPSPARREPIRTARSQSTIPGRPVASVMPRPYGGQATMPAWSRSALHGLANERTFPRVGRPPGRCCSGSWSGDRHDPAHRAGAHHALGHRCAREGSWRCSRGGAGRGTSGADGRYAVADVPVGRGPALGAQPDAELGDLAPPEVRQLVTWGRPLAGS